MSKISVDFDGVILEHFLNASGFTETISEIRLFSMNNVFTKFGARVMKLYQPFRHPVPGALEGVKEISTSPKVEECALITSRVPDLVTSTNEWMKQNGYDSILLKRFYNEKWLMGWEHKLEQVKREAIDVHIDDDPNTCKQIAGQLHTVLVIHLAKGRPKINSQLSNLVSVESWANVVSLLRTKNFI